MRSAALVAKVYPLATVSGLLFTRAAWQYFSVWLAKRCRGAIFQQRDKHGILGHVLTPTHEDEPRDLPFCKLSPPTVVLLSSITYFKNIILDTVKSISLYYFKFKIDDVPLYKHLWWSIAVLCKFSSASTFICSCVSCLIDITMCTSLHNNNYFYSHRILTMTSLVKGFPTPLSAVHLYLSLFFPRKTFKGIVTTALSETLLQVIVGFGFPSAEQFKINSSGAIMVWLLEDMILLGGPTKSNWSLQIALG